MKKIMVAGASGLIGTRLLRQAAAQAGLAPIALLRQAPLASIDGVEHMLVDFEHLSDIALPQVDAAFCCLGTTIKVAGSQQAFRHVDLELVVHFAEAVKRAGSTCFVLVSAAGANLDSRVFYSRIKAEAERAVEKLGFKSLVIARPSLLLGDRDALKQPGRSGESLAQSVGRVVAPLVPLAFRPITDAHLARVLLAYGLAAPPGMLIVESAVLHSR